MKKISVILDDDLYETTRTLAFTKRTTIPELIRGAIKSLLDKPSVGKMKKPSPKPEEESVSSDGLGESDFDTFLKKMWSICVPDPSKYNSDKLGRIRREFKELWDGGHKTVLFIDVSNL